METTPKRRGRPPKTLDNKFGPIGNEPQHIHPAFRDKEPSRPWEKQGGNPWRLDMMKLSKKREGFRPRWVSPAKVDQRLMQGWVIASRKDYALDHEISVEGTEVGNKLKRREMILMEIPEDLARQKEQYNEEMLKKRDSAIKRNLQREIGDTSPIHGKIDIPEE